ncbi:hypothetical protein QKW35_15905 [Pontibacterium granulatum]|uniref:hypothetical protein n=1 Tax=Pontibacterium granulatum TaxID=2036029 RepID=UPI002499FC38|nr:hypothetical protein [Pontibacterium granulatum]MDI3325864.1 hypothetical protein [Pontibacterium granulatum]
MNYKERQFGKVFVEFFVASLLLTTVVVTGFSIVGTHVNEHVDKISTSLIQEPERTEDGTIVVSDAFLNQFGPTAAGPKEIPPQPLVSVAPNGSVIIKLTTETILWGAAMLVCLVLSVFLFRLAFRRF